MDSGLWHTGRRARARPLSAASLARLFPANAAGRTVDNAKARILQRACVARYNIGRHIEIIDPDAVRALGVRRAVDETYAACRDEPAADRVGLRADIARDGPHIRRKLQTPSMTLIMHPVRFAAGDSG